MLSYDRIDHLPCYYRLPKFKAVLKRIKYEDKIIMRSFIPWFRVGITNAGSSTIINSEFMVTRNDSTIDKSDSSKNDKSDSSNNDNRIKRPNLLAIPKIKIAGSFRTKATRPGGSGLEYLDLSRM